jgi:hypothetical protein
MMCMFTQFNSSYTIKNLFEHLIYSKTYLNIIQFCSYVKLSLPHVRNSISRVQQVVTLLILPINIVLACMYIGQSKMKCFKFSRAAPHRQDGSDTIPTRNKSKFKNEAEFLS